MTETNAKTDDTLNLPEGLTQLGEKVAKAILRVASKNAPIYTGGCRAFYSPQEWRDRGEPYGKNAILIVVHDGGDLRGFFNYDAGMEDRYQRIERMNRELEKLDVYAECMTGWATAIYLA